MDMTEYEVRGSGGLAGLGGIGEHSRPRGRTAEERLDQGTCLDAQWCLTAWQEEAARLLKLGNPTILQVVRYLDLYWRLIPLAQRYR